VVRVCCVVVHRARQVVLVLECVQFSEYAARRLPIDGWFAEPHPKCLQSWLMGHDAMGHGSEGLAAAKHKQLSSQAAAPAVCCGACLLVIGKITAHVTCDRIDTPGCCVCQACRFRVQAA
jgi:hypothetical protein